MTGNTLNRLLNEIETIDRQSIEMATLVAKNPVLRDTLAEKATRLREKLNDIASELRNTDPAAYHQIFHQISESILDLTFVEMDMNILSLRLIHFIEAEKLKKEKRTAEHSSSFPIPENAHDLQRTLKSDLIGFQTALSLEEITNFYRNAFARRGFKELELITSMSERHISLAFESSPCSDLIVVQAVDMAYSMEKDMRHVSIRTEKRISM